MDELGPGVVVAGRYRLDRLLGRGGMGHVWAVTHEVTHRTAALKFLSGPVHLKADRSRRFLREARAASAVNHPNVVTVHDFFELEDGTPVMLMDLLEGETLRKRLARESTLCLEDAAEVLLPLVSAVGTAHARGIVHRDLKPDNVFLARTPAGALDVRVLDFGVAKLMAQTASGGPDADALTGSGAMLGTPSYMSPEQSFGEGTVDHRADIWSIGVLAYEMLSGSKPIDGENIGQILKRLVSSAITPLEVLVPDLPPDVTGLVGRMLNRNPSLRPADLREVKAILSRYSAVQVPDFAKATGEAPPPFDSSPTSGRISAPPSVRVSIDGASDPDAATVASEPTDVTSKPGFAAERTPETRTQGKRRRGGLVAAALFAVAVGLVASWRLGASASATATDVAREERPPPVADVLAAGPANPPPSAVAEAPRPPAETEPASSARPPDRRAAARPTVRPPAPPPASGSASPPRIDPKRQGLIDEPPF